MSSRNKLLLFNISHMMWKNALFTIWIWLTRRSRVAVLNPEEISGTAVTPGEWMFYSFLTVLFESRPDAIEWCSVQIFLKELVFARFLSGISLFGFVVI